MKHWPAILAAALVVLNYPGAAARINQIRAVALANAARGSHAKRSREAADSPAGPSGSGPRCRTSGDEARADAGPHTISY